MSYIRISLTPCAVVGVGVGAVVSGTVVGAGAVVGVGAVVPGAVVPGAVGVDAAVGASPWK